MDQVFQDFRDAAKVAMGPPYIAPPKYALSFTEQAEFHRFVRNIPVLAAILNLKPKSIYGLARALGRDVSNLNKDLNFLEELGVIRMKRAVKAGRKVRRPIAIYDEVSFRLSA